MERVRWPLEQEGEEVEVEVDGLWDLATFKQELAAWKIKVINGAFTMARMADAKEAVWREGFLDVPSQTNEEPEEVVSEPEAEDEESHKNTTVAVGTRWYSKEEDKVK